MFNVQRYVDSLIAKPEWDKVVTYAYAESQMGNITIEQWFDVLKEVSRREEEEENQTTSIPDYLKTVVDRATPEAVKQAKKSLKAYCEYLIYSDEKQGAMSANTATAAKQALPNYLTKIRPTMNDE